MARRKKPWWMQPKKIACPPVVYSVIEWRKDGRYRQDDAIKTYKRESAAENFTDKNRGKNWVVRTFHAETGEQVFLDPSCRRKSRRAR